MTTSVSGAQSLQGTVALVTGASSGIGRATALELAVRGAAVAITARRRDRLVELAGAIEALGGVCLVLEADISQREQATAVVSGTVEKLGRLDTVVNSAGVMLNGPSIDTPIEDWEAMVAVNVSGLVYVSKAALPHLLSAVDTGTRGVADLVNISSIAGRLMTAEVAIYNATKAAVNAFTEALRLEFTKRSLRVSVVSPGVTESELFDHLAEPTKLQYAEWFADVEKLHAQDIADAIAYIVTSPRRVAVNEMIIRPTDHQ